MAKRKLDEESLNKNKKKKVTPSNSLALDGSPGDKYAMEEEIDGFDAVDDDVFGEVQRFVFLPPKGKGSSGYGSSGSRGQDVKVGAIRAKGQTQASSVGEQFEDVEENAGHVTLSSGPTAITLLGGTITLSDEEEMEI